MGAGVHPTDLGQREIALNLAAEALSVEASVFELGGNSLRAVVLARRLTEALGPSASISPTTAIDASFSSLNSFSDRVAVSIDSVNFCSTGTSGSFPIAS